MRFGWRQLALISIITMVWSLAVHLPSIHAVDQPQAAVLVVQLPTSAVGAAGSQVMLPVMVEGVSDQAIFSYQFTVRFDPLVLTGLGVDTANSLSAGWNIAENHQIPGEMLVAAFHTTPLTGSGRLLHLRFAVVGQNTMQTALRWHQLLLNEGQPTAQSNHGLFQVTSVTATPTPTVSPTTTPPPRTTVAPPQHASYLPFMQK